mgnify:CR=1 FL=1
MGFVGKIAEQWKAMPTWQKGITALGFLTVGVTITLTTTALVKKSIGLVKSKTEPEKDTQEISTGEVDAKIIDAVQQLAPKNPDQTTEKKAV